MLKPIAEIERDHSETVEKLASKNLTKEERASLQKRVSRISDILAVLRRKIILENNLNELKNHIELEKNDLLTDLYTEEINKIEAELKEAIKQLDYVLYPPDVRDKASAFIEIRSGAGGQEAALFASDLFKMYSNYALSRNWVVSLVESSETDLGGYNKIVLSIEGRNVFGSLKFESGVHRVQRVPKTEGAGRIHTSTVTVAVLPEVENVEVDIHQKDLRVDVYRSSGAGGQHVNTTDSAVRITHIPSGLVVTCQEERSQTKNKAKAMKVLQSRLWNLEQEKRELELATQRKQQIGSGDRAEKIRTYNFPQNRITDHRINLTLMKLDIIIQGELNDLINPIKEWSIEEQKKRDPFL